MGVYYHFGEQRITKEDCISRISFNISFGEIISGASSTDEAFSGWASIKYSDGVIFEGNMKNGKFEGYGVMLFPDGDSFVGNFSEGKFKNGKYKHSEGSVFSGEFFPRLENGNSSLDLDGGYLCEKFLQRGKWIKNLAEGMVEISYSNGDRFTGLFKEGKRNGMGTYLFSDGVSFSAIYENDIVTRYL